MSGKGSRRRPTNEQAFGNNFDSIFGKGKAYEANDDSSVSVSANCLPAELQDATNKSRQRSEGD